MISDRFEKTLQRAQDKASSLNHQYMTLEHLLFAMTEDEDVMKILDDCNINISALKDELENFLKNSLNDLFLIVKKKLNQPLVFKE